MRTFLYCLKASVLFSFLFASVVLAQSSAFNWSIKGGGTGKDYGNALAIDSTGNIYVTGEFTGTATFDTISVVSAGNVDYYLVKYDSDHAVQWVKKGGGTLTDRGYGVAVDKSGNIITTGHLYSTAVFDGVSLVSGGNLDVFTAKYSSDGVMQWIKQGSGLSQVSSRSVAVDTAGNSIVVGYFGTSGKLDVTFGSTTLTSNGDRDAFIIKYDPDGNLIWAHTAGGLNSGEEAKDVAVDVAGNIYVTGMFVDSASFDGLSIYGNGGSDIFVAKYDKDGQIIWAKSAGGPYDDDGRSIAINETGQLYIGGRFDSVAVFGVDTFYTAGLNDAYVARYDTDGNFEWLGVGGSDGDDYCNDIALDGSGNIYGIGQFSNTATFGTTEIVSAGLNDAFMLKLNDMDKIEWVNRVGATDIDRGISVAVDYDGNFYGTGYFRLAADFGDSTLTSAGLDDMFLTKITPVIVPVELVSFTISVNNNNIVSLNWKTATELNNSGFEIQRSIDGVTYNRIGFVNGSGTTTQANSYSFIDNSPSNSKNYYRLKQIDFDGTFEYSQIVEVGIGIPATYQVSKNYPNPFNPTTNVKIDLPVESNVSYKLYNSIGETVKIFDSKEYAAGTHVLQIDGSNLSSGVYYFSIRLNGKDGTSNVKTSKMILLK